jgi:hypothetical protein
LLRTAPAIIRRDAREVHPAPDVRPER